MSDEKQVRQLDLTAAQFEHTLGIISEIDLSPLLTAFSGGGRMMDLLSAVPMLGQVREKRIMRRLEAVWSATPDELERAEADSVLMATLENQAAKKPVKDTMEGFAAFFAGLGLSLDDTGASSSAAVMGALKKLGESEPALPADPSRSGD